MPAFRVATTADLPAICSLGDEINHLHHAAVPHVFARPSVAGRDRDHWAASVEAPEAQTFVADDGGEVVGFVTVAIARETHSFSQPITFGRIGTVVVAGRRQGRGIGRELMRLAHAWVLAHGGSEVRLTVWAFNTRAQDLYRELGYEVRSLNLAKELRPEA